MNVKLLWKHMKKGWYNYKKELSYLENQIPKYTKYMKNMATETEKTIKDLETKIAWKISKGEDYANEQNELGLLTGNYSVGTIPIGKEMKV